MPNSLSRRAKARSAVAAAVALAIACHPGPGLGDATLPNMGDPAGAALSTSQEDKIGKAFMRSVRARLALVDDPELNDYLSALAGRLVQQSEAPARRFEFFVVRDSTINAFAAPGGYIGIHSGLWLAAETEAELAAVLAHEIAHITQRHIARSFEAAQGMSLAMAGALIAAILIGSRDSQAGHAAIAATVAGSQQQQINFTRENEKEADSIGMQILARAGFDPHAMAGFFERLQQTARYHGSAPEFLSTHPITVNRIAEARSRAEQIGRPPPSETEQRFRLARAKLDVLAAADRQAVLERYRQRLGDEPRSDVARYGLALAQLEHGDPGSARRTLEPLLEREPESVPLLLAAAAIEEAAQDAAAAERHYQRGLALYPDHHALALAYAGALLRTGRHAAARDLIERQLRRREATAPLYEMLARAAGGLGQAADTHRYLAEAYYLNGQTKAAIEQLSQALRLPGTDAYRNAQLEARLKQLQDEFREEEAARRAQ